MSTTSPISEQLHRTMRKGAIKETSPAGCNVTTTGQTPMENSKSASAKPPPTLLTLPPELRNRIWEFALIEDGPITVPATFIIRGPIKDQYAVSYQLNTPGLLATNKQIRREALPIYYSGNIFATNSRVDTYTFLRRLSAEQRSMLTRLQVNFIQDDPSTPKHHQRMTDLLFQALHMPKFARSQMREPNLAENREEALRAEQELAEAGLRLQPGTLQFAARYKSEWIHFLWSLRGSGPPNAIVYEHRGRSRVTPIILASENGIITDESRLESQAPRIPTLCTWDEQKEDFEAGELDDIGDGGQFVTFLAH